MHHNVHTLGLFIVILYVIFCILIAAAAVYLFILVVKALKKYIASKDVRKEKESIKSHCPRYLKKTASAAK